MTGEQFGREMEFVKRRFVDAVFDSKRKNDTLLLLQAWRKMEFDTDALVMRFWNDGVPPDVGTAVPGNKRKY